MFNRRIPNILVPKDANAEKYVINSEASLYHEYYVISISESDMSILWKSKIFDRINEKFGILIDSHEEEEITDIEQLKLLKIFLHQELSENGDFSPIVNVYTEYMILLVDKAIKLKMGIYFLL